jgi:hypothetical protein
MKLMQAYERNIRRKPRGYELMKMFSPHAFLGYAGRQDD